MARWARRSSGELSPVRSTGTRSSEGPARRQGGVWTSGSDVGAGSTAASARVASPPPAHDAQARRTARQRKTGRIDIRKPSDDLFRNMRPDPNKCDRRATSAPPRRGHDPSSGLRTRYTPSAGPVRTFVESLSGHRGPPQGKKGPDSRTILHEGNGAGQCPERTSGA